MTWSRAIFTVSEPPENRLSEIHLRPIAERLARIVELDDQPLHIARKPEGRALQRCNSFALMLVTMLRAKGVPARSRCGFAVYFNPPNFEDHWVCEYWNAQTADGAWRTRRSMMSGGDGLASISIRSICLERSF